jgi:hypothetical protein
VELVEYLEDADMREPARAASGQDDADPGAARSSAPARRAGADASPGVEAAFPAASSARAARGAAIAIAAKMTAATSARATAASCGMRAERPLFAWYAER